MNRLSSETESGSRISHALQVRRAAGLAGKIPGHWLLDSPGLAAVLELARKFALAPGAPVLIEGERGTGVPELARLIHDADPSSRRGHFRMLAANLVSPSDIRGWSFDGTVFIEDVEHLRPAVQAWLAEVLASRTQLPGSPRVIAGSRRSVDQLLHDAGLRAGLVCALDVGRLVLPPLRTRTGDILGLARRFLGHYAEWQGRSGLEFSAAAERKLLTHTYPANVCELRSVVERAAALATASQVVEDAMLVFERAESQSQSPRADLPRPAGAIYIRRAPRVRTLAQSEVKTAEVATAPTEAVG